MTRTPVLMLAAALVFGVGAAAAPSALAGARTAPPVPRTIVLDGAQLATIRQQVTAAPTRMNPNMKYGQVVPCTTTGRKEGIIESSQALTQVVDGLALLDSGAPGWTAADHSGMVSWLTAFQKWNRTSSLGKAESKATN